VLLNHYNADEFSRLYFATIFGTHAYINLYLSVRNSSNHSGPKLFPESRFLKTISSEKIRLIYGNIRGYENIVKLPLLTDIYENYDRMQGLSKFKEYAHAYETHIGDLRRRKIDKGHVVNLLEIGVQDGGSIEVWSIYFGNLLRYTGLDINPKCKRWEDPDRYIHIESGSQTNDTLIRDICTKFGPFDLVVDDGGHMTEQIIISLRALWPACMKDKSVYAIEDLHTMVSLSNLFFLTYRLYLITHFECSPAHIP